MAIIRYFVVCFLCTSIGISSLLAAPVSLLAAPVGGQVQVEIWGHPDCIACVGIKNALQRRKVNVRTHNVKNHRVENYYVKTFGRGRIPVVRIGSKIIRGNKLDQVLRIIESGEGNKDLQRCTNGKVLENFYKSSEKKLAAITNVLPQRADPIDIALDLCYGAKGWISCGETAIPYTKLDRLGAEYVVKTTSGKSESMKISECRNIPYNFGE